MSVHLEYAALWPILVVFGVAFAGVGVEAFVTAGQRRVVQPALALGGLVAALVGVAAAHPRGLVGEGALSLDGPALVLQGLILVASIGGVLLFADVRTAGASAFAGSAATVPGSIAERRTSGETQTEVYPLLMLAVGGMLLFVAASDLLLLFVGLEVLSLPLYLLTGLARHRRLLSQEAAMKYFLLGAFSSAFVVYGIAMAYGASGSLDLTAIAGTSVHRPLLGLGLALIGVGLLFKVGAVPFHSWIPDVYVGAPVPVVAWMSAATKIAAIGALVRVLWLAFGGQLDQWRPALVVLTIATLAVGAVLSAIETDVLRQLAYSAIAHTGFVLIGVAAGDTRAIGVYLVAYAAATVGAFAIAGIVQAGGGAESRERWRGLGVRHPWLGGGFAVLLLSLAGVPPTAGFLAKYSVFAAALRQGQWPLVVAGIVASVIALFGYLRVVRTMFFERPADDAPTLGSARVGLPTAAVVTVTVVATLVVGVWPAPLLSLLDHAGGLLG